MVVPAYKPDDRLPPYVPASGHVADALGITEGENVIHLRTLRRVNGVALCLIDHYFADLTLWPTLQRFDSGSLHDFLREQTGIALRRSQIAAWAAEAMSWGCTSASGR